MAAAAEQLTPVELEIVYDLRRLAQVMIRVLAETGSGMATPEVRSFQRAWNGSQALVDKVTRLNGEPPYWYHLVEDGMYGPKTSGALSFVVGFAAPRRASGIPTWYAVNRDRIDALVPPSTDPLEPAFETAQPLDETSAQDTVDPERLLEEAKSGSVATQISPQPAPTSVDSPPADPVAQEPIQEALAPELPEETVEAMVVENEPVVQIVEPEVIRGEDVSVVAAPQRGAVPWVAVGVGALALGGVLFYFTRRGRRRAA